MNPFLEWLLALVVGVALAIIFCMALAFAVSFINIWAAGVVVLVAIFCVVALYFIAYKEEE